MSFNAKDMTQGGQIVMSPPETPDSSCISR